MFKKIKNYYKNNLETIAVSMAVVSGGDCSRYMDR